MTDNYTLEDGTGILVLENLDNYQLDVPLKIINDNIGVTEIENRLHGKTILEVLGVSDSNNHATGFVKVAAQSIMGLTDSFNKKISEFEYLIESNGIDAYELEDGTGIYLQDYPLKVSNSTAGITEASQRLRGFSKIINETLGITTINNHIFGFVKVVTSALVTLEGVVNTLLSEINVYALESGLGVYINEDGTGGRYEFDQLAILQNISTVLGITETSQKVKGLLQWINTTLAVNESNNRARIMLRNIATSTIGINEASNRAGIWIRNLSSTVGITETINRLGVIKRNLSSTVGITEASEYFRGLTKNLTSTVGLTGANNIVTGIVKQIADTIGLTEVNNKIRSVFISFNTGVFIADISISLSNFIANAGTNNSDLTVIDSYNVGNLNLTDDD